MFEEEQLSCAKRSNSRVRRRAILVFEEEQFSCSKKSNSRVRRRAILVFEEEQFSCSKKSNCRVRRKTKNAIFMIFGRTDLRISLSRAKFDAEADFDVRSAAEPPKPHQISKKQNFRSGNFAEKKSLASKNETSGIV